MRRKYWRLQAGRSSLWFLAETFFPSF